MSNTYLRFQRLAYIGRRARLGGAHAEAREFVIDSSLPEDMEMGSACLEIALPHQCRRDGRKLELACAWQGVVFQDCRLVEVLRHSGDAFEKSLCTRRLVLAVGCGELGINRLDLRIEHDDGIRVDANVRQDVNVVKAFVHCSQFHRSRRGTHQTFEVVPGGMPVLEVVIVHMRPMVLGRLVGVDELIEASQAYPSGCAGNIARCPNGDGRNTGCGGRAALVRTIHGVCQ